MLVLLNNFRIGLSKEDRQMTVIATGAASRETADWSQIDWSSVRRTVRRLQMRIAKAVREGRWGKVQALEPDPKLS